jgi:Tol biopolymer transport system component
VRTRSATALLGISLLCAGLARAEPLASPSTIAFVSNRAPNLLHVEYYAVRVSDHARRPLFSSLPRIGLVFRSHGGGRIAYARSVGGVVALYTRRLGGGPELRLTPPTLAVAEEFGVAFSPDGRWLAFPGYTPCQEIHCARLEVWVVRVDGSGLRRLASGHSPSWSPDGQTLAYSGDLDYNNDAYGVYAIRRDGTGNRRLAGGSGPVWAPRGTRIAYSCRGLCVIGADGKAGRVVLRGRPSNPVWSPDARLLVALRAGDLYVVGADGRGARRLTSRGGTDVPVTWSSDGSRVVFLRSVPPSFQNNQLWVIRATGGRATQVTREPPNTTFQDVRWPRPGTWITFGAFLADNDAEIAVTAPDGTGYRRLTSNLVEDRDPAWSPDGKSIAFSRAGSRSNTAALWLMRSDGSRPRRLTRADARRDTNPAWSPDGRQIAFVRAPRNAFLGALVIARADGSGARTVPTPPVFPARISWAPDGKTIALAAEPGNWPAIYSVGADGAGLTRVTQTIFAAAPSWAPDGSRILFSAEHDEPSFGRQQDLYVVAPDGSGVTRVVEDVAFNEGGDWSPDGKRIVFARPPAPFEQVAVANADGTGERAITTEPATNAEPSWR